MELELFFEDTDKTNIPAFLDDDAGMAAGDAWEQEYLDNLDDDTTVLD